MVELEKYFSSYASKLIRSGKDFSFTVDFYPYRSTFVKIFRKDYHITIRFSNQLKDASQEVLKAGGREMIHRLARKRALATDKVIFRQYINQLPVSIEKIKHRRKDNNPKGLNVDLLPIFNSVNEKYFNHSLNINGMGWTKNIVRSYYANYSLGISFITFNRAFDHPDIPSYVLEYLMYHEALHSIYPPRMIQGRFVKHTKEFKKNEKLFREFKNSKDWLKKNGNRFIKPAFYFRRAVN